MTFENAYWGLVAFISGLIFVLLIGQMFTTMPPNFDHRWGRIGMFLRMVRRAYEVESRRFVWEKWKPRGRIRGFFVVCRMLYPMFRITGQQYWKTEVWYPNPFEKDGWRPMIVERTAYRDAYTARLWDYPNEVELVNFCYGYECRWRGWVIPLECLWGNLLPDPTDAQAAKVTRDLEMDVF